ncbi:hypothetical protein [Oryzobacter telluris]|uniref:hypothetical protein n=1 Tax=Oryzobacter telluris TaxID=3149179 RepID=UPI00370D5FC0
MDTGGGVEEPTSAAASGRADTTTLGDRPVDTGAPGLAARVLRPQAGDVHRAVGVVLLLLWSAWLVGTVLAQPRFVDDARFGEDVRAGEVTSWRVVTATQGDGARRWTEGLELDAMALTPGGEVDDDAGHRGVLTIAYSTRSAPSTRVLDTTTEPLPARYTDALRAAGVPQATGWTGAPPTDRPAWVTGASVALVVLYLTTLVAGPPPTRGTRWFWFWFLFPTLGVGTVVYAVMEQLRPRPVSPGQDRRSSGWVGWGWSIVLVFSTHAVLLFLLETDWIWLVRP